MGTIGKGSKIKVTIDITEDSLGGKTLGNLDYRVDFYAKEKKDSNVTGFCSLEKGDPGIIVSGTQIIAACDTTGLDLGKLYATLTIGYSDDDLHVPLVERQTLTCDVTIIDAPQQAEEEQGG